MSYPRAPTDAHDDGGGTGTPKPWPWVGTSGMTISLRRRGWVLEPKFHFGYRERGLCWSSSSLPLADYVAYWAERIKKARAVPREDWTLELDRLITDGVFAASDRAQFDADFTNTQRPHASPPGDRARPLLDGSRRGPGRLSGRVSRSALAGA